MQSNPCLKSEKQAGILNGVQLAVYDRERTICDCFKYVQELDNEMFGKELNAYAADKKKNTMSNLSNYAERKCGFTKN